jgi:TrmH family RNA methyltransferase
LATEWGGDQLVEAFDIFDNPRSERVKMLKALAGRHGRFANDPRVLAEGPQAVKEAIAEGCVRDLWLTEQLPDGHRLAEATRQAGGYVHWASQSVLGAISPASQGVAAVADWPIPQLSAVLTTATAQAANQRAQASGTASAKNVATARRVPLVAVFERVGDPGNAGTAIRAADCAGATAVCLANGSVDPRAAKVIRCSAGSYFHLPVFGGVDLVETVAQWRQAGCQVLAATADGAADLVDLLTVRGGLAGLQAETAAGLEHLTSIAAANLVKPTVWLFGSEAGGLSETARQLADQTVRIPIYGRAESLNLAMAATVCLYASALAGN